MQLVPKFSERDVITVATSRAGELELRVGKDQASRFTFLTVAEARQVAYGILLETERLAG